MFSVALSLILGPALLGPAYNYSSTNNCGSAKLSCGNIGLLFGQLMFVLQFMALPLTCEARQETLLVISGPLGRSL